MINKVYIKKWCISCKNYENICPSIFKVVWKSSVIFNDYEKYKKQIFLASQMCPVNVIKVESDENIKEEIKKAQIFSKKFLNNSVLELWLFFEKLDFKPG